VSGPIQARVHGSERGDFVGTPVSLWTVRNGNRPVAREFRFAGDGVVSIGLQFSASGGLATSRARAWMAGAAQLPLQVHHFTRRGRPGTEQTVPERGQATGPTAAGACVSVSSTRRPRGAPPENKYTTRNESRS